MLTIQAADECVSDHGKAMCADLGGECVTLRDGYYVMQAVCITAGALLLVFLVSPQAKKLQGESPCPGPPAHPELGS